MVYELKKIIPSVENFDFMFRGKKLVHDKSLGEQGVKENTKLMMYPAKLSKVNSLSQEQESYNNKEIAKSSLIKMGFNKDMVDSVVKTIPNIDNLSLDIIIEKSLIFLKSLTKETLSEYSVEIETSNTKIMIDEEKLTKIFALGDGMHGQLGVSKYIKSDFPLRVNSLRNLKIKAISCGMSHTLALTLNGYGNLIFII
jgi:hypothetical protein